MLIVGIQCGHDASVVVLQDGRILIHLERERVSRIRHDESMSADLIHQALRYCGLDVGDIDMFALSTTQRYGYQSDDAARLSFAYDWETAEKIGTDRFRRTVFDRAAHLAGSTKVRAIQPGGHQLFNSEWPDMPDIWMAGRGMEPIGKMDGEKLGSLFSAPSLWYSQALPMTVTLDGRNYPAVGVMHQLAHASAAFYQSAFDAAPVLAHDNGNPVRRRNKYVGGMLFYGEGHRLSPIWTAPIAAGVLYSLCAQTIGLGRDAGPGKLMGLSAYGSPSLFDERFIGDVEMLAPLYMTKGRIRSLKSENLQTVVGWFHEIERHANELGLDVDGGALSPFGKDLAATAQKTFEELVLYVLRRLQLLLTKTGRMGPNLCLSGGCALNCPANSRIVEETDFSSVFVPPSCDDGGLSIGAALYLYHHILEHPRTEATDHSRNIAALGRVNAPADVARALAAASDEFEIETGIDLAERAAGDLADNRVVALFQGRSESGPRALGHRSLLADPRKTGNWARVNGLKSRELWRPFAPATLSERLRDNFDGGPAHSPHMLFNFRVRSKELGAVTHVDGSARVQTVAPGAGPFRDVIEAFGRRTGTPVVMNTSLNGPGEPIVETPEQALAILRRTAVDVLYVENNRVRKRST